MFQRSDKMYAHANDLVKSALQLRQELEANRTARDHGDCILLLKAMRQRNDALAALIDQAWLDSGDVPEDIADCRSQIADQTSPLTPQSSDLTPLKLTGALTGGGA